MAHLAAAEIVVPKDLTADEKQELADNLYDVHARIFDGVDKSTFVKYVVDSKAEHTWIQIYRDDEGRIVGYFALHFFERELHGQKLTVIRGETGILRAYRGGNVILTFMAGRVIQYKLWNPGRKLYYLGSLVHPSSYAQLVRYVDEVWPREGAQAPADVQALMADMGESFGLERVEAANPLLRKVGWKTIDSTDDRAYWQSSERPGVRFFLDANPGYRDGHGLLTLAPITLGTLVQGLGRYAGVKVAKRTRQFGATLRAELVADSAFPRV